MKALFPVLVGALVALVVGDLLILGVGQSPAEVYRLLLEGTWGNPYGFAQVLYKATTLTFTGLAVALALRAGLFNIGAEAQLALGGFAASVMGLVLPVGVPAPLAIIACIVAAAMGGAVGGAVPGALNAWFGANEVITTILLNFVVLFFLNWVVTAHLHVAETVHTPALINGTVPRLSIVIPAFRGSAANATVLLAIAAAVVTGWFVFRTRYGYELRAVGLSPDAAEAAGIVLPRVRVATFTLAGALAGMGGTNFVLGYKHYYEDGFTGGAGLIGIAVALAGRAHPIGIMLAALAFATLSQGGLAIHALVPKQMADILQGVVILAIAIASRARA
ncbi:MAG TPA: ABC transporter permease [Gemmatimonadaceae bacterium]|nr:ABC transporter permease [Gemmatimonadaceae bacterium]